MFRLPTDKQVARITNWAATNSDKLLKPVAEAFLTGPRLPMDGTHVEAVSDLHQWIADGMAAARMRRLMPVAVDREVSLSEAVAAFKAPCLQGEWRFVPISTIGNDPDRSILTPELNLQFRFLHDWLHAHMSADGTFAGELALTLGHMVSAPSSTWRILASEVAGQAAVAITTGSFPEQNVSAGVLSTILGQCGALPAIV